MYDSEQSLVREGLMSYRDARYAIQLFEGKIQAEAQSVMRGRLEDFKSALGNGSEVAESDIKILADRPELGGAAIGAFFAYDWGIRFGLGWREIDQEVRPIAILMLRSSNTTKRDRIFSALKKQSLAQPRENISVLSSDRYRDAVVMADLSKDSDLIQIRTQMADVFAAFIDWASQAGSIHRVINP